MAIVFWAKDGDGMNTDLFKSETYLLGFRSIRMRYKCIPGMPIGGKPTIMCWMTSG